MTIANKWGLTIIAILLALCLGAAAFAEGTDTPAAETPAAETPAADASAIADEAQASADALKEALTAYANARADSRKQAVLDALKQDLDTYVVSGKLTQEQADLILKYYAEQQALQQNGIGRGGKGMRNGQGMPQNNQGTQQNGRNGQGMQQNGFGKNGRGNRFGNMPDGSGNSSTDANSSATPKGNPDI